MSYKTELMEEILQSSQAQEMIKMISPHYGKAYVFLWLLQVIGMALDETQDWSDKLATEVTPATVTWSINYWEAEYGITPESWWSLEQRRKNLINTMHYLYPMPPQRLEDIIANVAGIPVNIIENTGKNKFDVEVRMNTRAFERIIAEIEKYKPAHLIYDIYISTQIYPEAITTTVGIVCQTNKRYEVEVI